MKKTLICFGALLVFAFALFNVTLTNDTKLDLTKVKVSKEVSADCTTVACFSGYACRIDGQYWWGYTASRLCQEV